MKLQFVENFTDGKAVMHVYGAIGVDQETGKGIDGHHFAQVINYLQEEPGVTEIEVRINSQGGVVLDALNIFNAIRASKKPCNTIIDGIAASSGGLVAMAGHKRMINDFGRLMVHAPSIPDSIREELDADTVKMIDEFQDIIADLLTANSKHDKAHISKLINDTTWLNAEKALEAGFVDEILSTGRDFSEIFNELDLNNADLALVVNQITNHKHPSQMELVKNTLGLDKNASEQVVNAAIGKLVEGKTDAENALNAEKTAHDATKTALTDAKNKLAEVNDTAATSFVENAIKEGKFAPEKKEALIAQAKNDLEGFKTLCESIAAPAKKITDKIDPSGDGKAAKAGEVVDGKLDGKTLRELEKSNPTLVMNLMTNEPKKYEALYAAQYLKA